MSKSRRVWILATIIFIAIILGSFVFGKRAFSYDTNIAHPNIVTIAALEYNKMYDPDLTLEEIGWMSDGAVEEDMPTRWLNHFYDPVYNKGLDNGKYPTAKDWSRMTNYQTTFALGDQTWYRAIDYWKKGDKKKAFKALGHILHLIADMSVPAHTRDDAHPTGDSYEQFVKNNWDKIAQYSARVEKKQVNSLDEVFDTVANFSNNNFYSDDTIKSKKYSIVGNASHKDIDIGDGTYYRFYINNNPKNGTQYYLYANTRISVWSGVIEDVDNLLVRNPYILTDYSKHLLSPATSYTIATIDLFFKEVQKEQNVKLAKYKNSLIGAADYLLGTVINKAEGLYNLFKGKDESAVMASESPLITSDTNNSPPIDTTTNNTNTDKTQNTLNITQMSDGTIQNVGDITQNSINKTQVREVIVENVKNASPAVNLEDSTAGVESVENVEKKSVKVEKPKEVVIVPNLPSPAPAVQEQVWYLGGSGGSGGGTANTPLAPLREGNLSTTPVDGSLTIPSSEEGTGGVGGGTTTPTESTATTTVDVADVAVATSTPDLIVTPPSEQATTSTESTATTTLDVVIATSTEQIATTTLDVVIATSTPDFITTSTLDIATSPPEAGPPLAETLSTTSTLEQIETPPPPAVVINEIAWAGTASSKKNSDDEWIELYSNATSTVDLTGWKILVNDKEIKLSGAINPGGFYLMERTKDKTVSDVTADLVFTLNNGLNNNGARLRVINSAGDVVDEVDASAGWFAGDNAKYRTMARRSVIVSGNDPENWFTSYGVAVNGRTDGGGVIYGSPKFSNYGYWLLKSPTFYYSDLLDADKVLTLTKANSPYIFMSPTEIPVGYTLKIEPGVVLVGLNNSSYFSVAGDLIVEGAVEVPIIFTSALDTNYVQTNLTSLTGSPAPGDWSRIQVEPGGSFIGSFVKFLYSGRTFKKSPGAMFGTNFYTNVIHNYGGSVNLENAEFSSNYFDSGENREEYSAVVFIEAPLGYDASLTISSSNFNGGWRAIKIFRQNNGRVITTNLAGDTFQNFQNPNQLIKSKYDFVGLSESAFTNNASDNVQIDMWTMSQDFTFDTKTQYSFNVISVPTGVTLTIEPGVKIKLAERGAVEVSGSIQANGTAEEPIVFEALDSDYRWGGVKFINSNSVFSYTNFIGGNHHFPQSDPNTRAVLMAENSTLNLNNISIINSRAPRHLIYSSDSNLNINNSIIGNEEKPELDMIGIKAKGGSVILDSVILRNLDFGIYGNFDNEGLLPHLELNNMTAENFINVDRLWEPNTWLSPAEE